MGAIEKREISDAYGANHRIQIGSVLHPVDRQTENTSATDPGSYSLMPQPVHKTTRKHQLGSRLSLDGVKPRPFYIQVSVTSQNCEVF